MKAVLFPTDCSAESALAFNNWLENSQGENLQVTIVYPYDIDKGAPLTKATFKGAKQEADQKLAAWLNTTLARNGWPRFGTRAILGPAETIVKSCLAVGSHAQLLIDENGFGLTNGVISYLDKTATELELTTTTTYSFMAQAA